MYVMYVVWQVASGFYEGSSSSDISSPIGFIGALPGAGSRAHGGGSRSRTPSVVVLRVPNRSVALEWRPTKGNVAPHRPPRLNSMQKQTWPGPSGEK